MKSPVWFPCCDPSSPLQAPSAALEPSGSREVFGEDGENPPSRSSECTFTDFVQYQGDSPEEAARAPHPHPALRAGRRSSGPSQTKALDKPVMQCCLEHFQQFLSRLITLYITRRPGDAAEGETSEVVQTPSEQRTDPESELVPKGFVAAFTAACQLFLECSSFPVYIAEGNLKASPTHEEQSGTCKTDVAVVIFHFCRSESGKAEPTAPTVTVHTSSVSCCLLCADCQQVRLPVWLQSLMDACCLATDFCLQGAAISLLMDLVGLTQSVAMVAAETVASGCSSESVQPMSPSQGRVAVVIRPPLTQGILKHIADRTDFFKVGRSETVSRRVRVSSDVLPPERVSDPVGPAERRDTAASSTQRGALLPAPQPGSFLQHL